MKEEKFDFEAFKTSALAKLKAGEGLTGASGAFTPLLKAFLEEALKEELEEHLSAEEQKRSKKKKKKKK